MAVTVLFVSAFAEERIKAAKSDKELLLAESKLKRALNRIDTSKFN